jgi:hypothetical protein
MKDETVEEAQNFLTIRYSDHVHQLLNVDLLLRRHGPEAVLEVLVNLKEHYRKRLKALISRDRTDPRINDLVAKRFRIRMAINVIRNEKREEVKAA